MSTKKSKSNKVTDQYLRAFYTHLFAWHEQKRGEQTVYQLREMVWVRVQVHLYFFFCIDGNVFYFAFVWWVWVFFADFICCRSPSCCLSMYIISTLPLACLTRSSHPTNERSFHKSLSVSKWWHFSLHRHLMLSLSRPLRSFVSPAADWCSVLLGG